MTEFAEVSTYATIVQAEAVVTQAGYVRDQQRHVWVKDGKAVRVVRNADNRFFVQSA